MKCLRLSLFVASTFTITLGLAGETHAEGSDCLHGLLVREGLRIVQTTCPEEPPIDVERVQAQRARGCGNTDIRFGDTAVMRGMLVEPGWREKDRKAFAAAALTDDSDYALAALDAVLADESISALRRVAMENQAILTALQFGHTDEARRRLAAAGPVPDGLHTALVADRALLSVHAEMEQATLADWQERLVPLLETAHYADSQAFGVRAWRVFAWFLAGGATTPGHCPDRIERFSDLMLDVSAASACPLLVGHFELALARLLATDGRSSSMSEVAWISFGSGLLAAVSGRPERIETALAELETRTQVPCSEPMANALRAVHEKTGAEVRN